MQVLIVAQNAGQFTLRIRKLWNSNICPDAIQM